jgi:hypothetical protein
LCKRKCARAHVFAPAEPRGLALVREICSWLVYPTWSTGHGCRRCMRAEPFLRTFWRIGHCMACPCPLLGGIWSMCICLPRCSCSASQLHRMVGSLFSSIVSDLERDAQKRTLGNDVRLYLPVIYCSVARNPCSLSPVEELGPFCAVVTTSSHPRLAPPS